MKTISVKELSSLLKAKELYILDVRNHFEVEFASIGGVNIPLAELAEKKSQVPADQVVYCLCHHGVRSQMAQDFLLQSGYSDVINIEGGIDAWSLEVDETIPRY